MDHILSVHRHPDVLGIKQERLSKPLRSKTDGLVPPEQKQCHMGRPRSAKEAMLTIRAILTSTGGGQGGGRRGCTESDEDLRYEARSRDSLQ